MNPLMIAIVSLLLVQTAAAQVQQEERSIWNSVTEVVAEDTTAATRYRFQRDNNGATTTNQLQYKIDLFLKLDLTQNLKVNSRVETGSRFNSGWGETGLGQNNSQREFNVRFKQLNLQYGRKEAKNPWNVQFGAIPVMSKDVKGKAAFHLDGDGWIDGARFGVSELSKWADSVHVTVGQIDELNQPNVFKRNFSGRPNFVQVQVQGKLSERLRYLTELTHLDNEDYVRTIADISVKEIMTFIDSFVIEEVMKVGQDFEHSGFSTSLKKAIGDWSLTGIYSYKARSLDEGKLRSVIEDEIRGGHQLSAYVERKTKFGTAYGHMGKTMSSNKLSSREGLRAEMGFKVPVGKLIPRKKKGGS